MIFNITEITKKNLIEAQLVFVEETMYNVLIGLGIDPDLFDPDSDEIEAGSDLEKSLKKYILLQGLLGELS